MVGVRCVLGLVHSDVYVTFLFFLGVAGVDGWEQHGFGLCGTDFLA